MSTNDSRPQFARLSPEAKAGILDELEAMHKGGHLRYASGAPNDHTAARRNGRPGETKRESEGDE